MSREIKFRAWGPNCKVMWDWEQVKQIANQLGWENLDQGERVLMQFTGLRDVNGVEIWEKDIVKAPGLGNAEVNICPHYGVVFVTKDYSQPYADGAAEGDYPTVIGNIYEHPHLLEGAK